MKTKITYPAMLLLLGLLLVSACSPIIPNTGANSDAAASATQNSVIAQAVEATSTTMAMMTEISRLQTQVAQPQATQTAVLPTVVPPTAEPTATATATMLPPTPTQVPPTPTITPIPLPCNVAQYVEDISVADGTEIVAGTSFTKTWRLRNAGACTWTTAYALAFFDGDRMGAQRITSLPFNVAPGQTIDATIDLIAPDAEGRYRGYWVLQTPSGEPFGTGRSNEAFYVDIRVIQPESHNPLDLSANYCMAEWSSGAGRLPCQGQNGDERGSVRRIANPVLETGYNDDEPVLLTQPQAVNDGIIRGKYPTMRIENGWHFVSVIGCAYNATDCDVRFQLDYQIGSGSIKNLATWDEEYDNSFQLVDVDLSALAGKDVNLILTVFANGSSHQDQAQWLAPHISTSVQWETPK
jgi:hypothetical protein